MSKRVQEPKYPLEELLENSEALFQCKPEVIAGALFGNEQKEFTIQELQDLIDKFLKRKVNK